ncbi:hypothetical protein F511_41870 [Dorcoceras hygrometricum]|uniref:Uncharacterized protein n=1 Tax=Dorcoceras hygrometricum TaxID=472368 RepID=A0A2Z7BUE0_9LAMI|nr:hypothetical protein F511_41870 [Dorcoceras hygrometricum]
MGEALPRLRVAAARPYAARNMVAAAAAIRRYLRKIVAMADISSRFSSGLSRAAHEVFGPIFDIWPILKFLDIDGRNVLLLSAVRRCLRADCCDG